MPAKEPFTSPASSGGGGGSPSAAPSTGEPMTTSEFVLQQDPAYYGQSGSNPAVYPAVGTTTPITPSGASAWVTDYNSVGFMPNDPIMGGSYSAPVGDLFSTDQGTNAASQVGIAYELQQTIYDTFTNVTGAGISTATPVTDFGAANAATRVTTDTIANPVTLPTTLSTWDLFGTAVASSGIFLDTPVIKQNAVATETPAAEAPKGGGLGLLAGGLIALKLLAVI